MYPEESLEPLKKKAKGSASSEASTSTSSKNDPFIKKELGGPLLLTAGQGSAAALAGHAQGDPLGAVTSPSEPPVAQPSLPKDTPEQETEESEEDHLKKYNRCEAKLRRMCEPKATTGRVDADPQLMEQWRQKGHARTVLVQLMMEAGGDKDTG